MMMMMMMKTMMSTMAHTVSVSGQELAKKKILMVYFSSFSLIPVW